MKHLGVSAFEKALPLINRLTALEKKWSERSFPLLNRQYVSVLKIAAGDGSITLPSTCEMLVNYTYYPDGYDYAGELYRLIEDVQVEDDWFREHPIHVELHHDCGPYSIDPMSSWPQTAAACVGHILGEKPEITGLPTGADSRLHANIGKMPCVVLGPGTILDCHNPNESISIQDLMDAVAVYAAILCEWCCVC